MVNYVKLTFFCIFVVLLIAIKSQYLQTFDKKRFEMAKD